MIMSLKQRKIKFKPRTKLNHNTSMQKAKVLEVAVQPSLSLHQLLTPFFPMLFFFGHFLGFIFINKINVSTMT